MKGTYNRGFNSQKDRDNRNTLLNDQKNRAENLMIVDLLRNDLGKISRLNTVKVQKLFAIEKYNTLFQMTSTISSITAPNTGLPDIFYGLFPSGSITGAPKIRTMQIIDELETEPRKIYTGAIGFMTPEKTTVFNVAIRTILIKEQKAEMGIGGGITYSSDPETEFEECRLKAGFLTLPRFRLIETMLYSKKEIALLELHLKRLKESAVFFGYDFPKKKILNRLNKLYDTLDRDKRYRIRLLLDQKADICLEYIPIEQSSSKQPLKIALSKKYIQKNNIFLYHKNTNRELYNREHAKYKRLGYFDVIFRNKEKQITEGAISNIYIEKNNRLYTPDIKCGLLPGVYRTHLFRQRRVSEKIISLEDLLNADNIYCSNAVRGLVKVELDFGN